MLKKLELLLVKLTNSLLLIVLLSHLFFPLLFFCINPVFIVCAKNESQSLFTSGF